ncbi:uncharacterized protein LOC132177903 [Corylus avellana]|uniref:uncharacterized protein LOC132177903 n=1 Tax=Corylus avellana TaxID=13451 RepID=UPI00286CD606|nr:uncharacterized protein LOC132177903 [Corylus avellana]
MEEIEVINTIPISHTNQPDVQIWRGNRSGEFSVRSAYHLAVELEGRTVSECSKQVKESSLWKTLWHLPISNAGKNFFCRACHNVLPTKDNLLRRKVIKEPFCPICEREPETVMHAIWSCLAATDVWGCSKKVFQKCAIEGNDFMLVAEFILGRCGKEDAALFIHLAHQIWMRRNKWVHEGNFINPNVLTKEAQAYVHEFQKVNELATSATDENVNKNENVKWSAPTQGWLKVNWDVAIDKAGGRMGIGAIVREEKGNVIATMCKTQSGSFEPTMGEALASFHAAILCRDLGI